MKTPTKFVKPLTTAQRDQLQAIMKSPAPQRTRMRAQAFPGEDPAHLAEPEAITDIFIRLADPTLTDTGRKFYCRAAA